MQIKLGLRQSVISVMVFCGVLLALVTVDARVRDRMGEIVSGGDGVTSWSGHVTGLAEALATALRYQSIENAPLLIFASVGIVLFLFMVKA